MSRTLIVLLLCLAAGCSQAPDRVDIDTAAAEQREHSEVDQWLVLLQEVQAMTPEEALEGLVKVQRPEAAEQQFRYALLNQRLESYGAWTQARDTLQVLQRDSGLTTGQRQLVTILLAYNQSRINWYLSYKELEDEKLQLERELQAAREKSEVLQQKIQALTDLETVISTRKED